MESEPSADQPQENTESSSQQPSSDDDDTSPQLGDLLEQLIALNAE